MLVINNFCMQIKLELKFVIDVRALCLVVSLSVMPNGSIFRKLNMPMFL